MEIPRFSPYIAIPRIASNHATQLKRVVPKSHRHIFSTTSTGAWIRESPYLADLLEQEKSVEQMLFEAYCLADHLIKANLIDALLSSDRRAVLLIGEPGSGKTTAINYLLRYSSAFVGLKKTHEAIIITCNINYSSDITLYQWVTAQITEQLIRIANENSFALEDVYADDVDFKGLSKAIKEAAARMESRMEFKNTDGPRDLDEGHRLKVFLGLVQGPGYSKRLLEWFEKRHPEKKIIIVLDNLDLYTPKQRAEIFANLLPVLMRQNVKVVIPLRPGTRLDHTDALHQYAQGPKIVPFSPPDFKRVLKLRLTKLPTGVSFRADAAGALKILDDIWTAFTARDAVNLLNGLFSTDTRQKLDIFRDALISNHFQSPSDYESADQLLRMLMLDEYCIMYPEITTRILNLFDNKSVQGYQNTLIRIRILQCIQMSSNLCLNAVSTIKELSGAYDADLIRLTITELIKSGLVEVPEMPGFSTLLPKQESGPSLVLTASGRYYLDYLLYNKTYVSICAQASLIPESVFRKENGIPLCKRIQQLLLDEDSLSEMARRLSNLWRDELFVSLDDFIDYIAYEEKYEAQKLSDTEFISAINISARMRAAFKSNSCEAIG